MLDLSVLRDAKGRDPHYKKYTKYDGDGNPTQRTCPKIRWLDRLKSDMHIIYGINPEIATDRKVRKRCRLS